MVKARFLTDILTIQVFAIIALHYYGHKLSKWLLKKSLGE